MKKRFLSILLALAMTVSTAVMPAAAVDGGEDASKYVMLDGEWNFKLYRTYPNMYQYFPYVGVKVVWEDLALSLLPDGDTFTGWESFRMPAENPETGGLLPTVRPLEEGEDEAKPLFPSWSEAWVCRQFELPANFTDNETVTLLLGIMDDNDVVYINGQVVASSGFVDGHGDVVLNVPAQGGFDYTAENPDAQVRWSKSYWEIQREYTIPADVLNQGGTNEICIRMYNNNGYGGFYSGDIFALCGNDLAVRQLKGLPTQRVESNEVMAAVEKQIRAIEAGDPEAFAATVAQDYHNDAANKADRVAQIREMIRDYHEIVVEDIDPAVYLDEQGGYWYSAKRTVSGLDEDDEAVIISQGTVEICYGVKNGAALERGNWNRCYQTSYHSDLFGEELTYSVYLPPSYYKNETATYPTVWLLHGRASSSSSYLEVDNIKAFMDEQISTGAIEEMVVIMPDSGKYAFYQDSELVDGDKENTGPWRTQLVSELRSEVLGGYRVYSQSQFHGLTGNSMGGYGAIMTAALYPDRYSSVAVHMGYLPDEVIESLKRMSAGAMDALDIYLDCGLQDATVGTAGTVAVHNYLKTIGKEHTYSLRAGGHNSAFYMSGMTASMKMHSDHFRENLKLVDRIAQFKDVNPEAYYADEVAWAVERGIASGDGAGSFLPNNALTRAQLVQMLYNMEGKPEVTADAGFADVAQDQWYAKAVNWAAANKVVSGYGNGLFGTNDKISREQLAVILFNYAKSKGMDVSRGEDVNILSYTDAFAISGYAYTGLQWACGAGIISGMGDGTVNPGGSATRGQTVVMLKNFCDNVMN